MQKNNVDIAIKIAKSVHKCQVDKLGYPYMAHVLDVASRVESLGKKYEIVGLLHDSIEDASSQSLRNEITTQIEQHFTADIVAAIMAMTHEDSEHYFDAYLPRLKRNDIAVQVKIADASHNLSKVHLLDDVTTQDRLRKKYVQALNSLGKDGKKCEQPLTFRDDKWVKCENDKEASERTQ